MTVGASPEEGGGKGKAKETEEVVQEEEQEEEQEERRKGKVNGKEKAEDPWTRLAKLSKELRLDTTGYQ